MIQPPYPRNVPLMKGALVTVDSANKTSIIAFQYNPETVRRNLKTNTVGGDEGNRSQSVRFTGAPVQTISVEVQIDAIDELDAGDTTAIDQGVYPQLDALELLAYPTTDQVTQYAQTLSSGAVSILPLTAPRTLFVWGQHRVMPVRLSSFSVVEELFDNDLNPIKVTVTLELRVLTYSDLFPDNPDYSLFLSYQKNLEQTSKAALSSSLEGFSPPTSGGGS